MEKNPTYSEVLKHENEITKLKLQAEFGLQMSDTRQLNPAIENIWLNQILEYERAMVHNKKITVGELLGNPSLTPVGEISDDDMPQNIQSLMELLQTKNIVVESISGIDDREMYRFITSELFLSETDSSVPKNMIVCFIYEEFHPNDEYDIKESSTSFIKSFASKDDDYFEIYLLSHHEEDIETLAENLIHKLKLFRDAFDKIIVEDFIINSIDIAESTAIVNFDFKFSVLPAESKNVYVIADKGKFNFVKMYDSWFIKGIEMTGVVGTS